MMIRLFSDEDHFINESVDQIVNACPDGRGNVALSGGSTPQKVYEALPSLPDVAFYQVDERYVPHNDERSNHKLITQTINPKDFHFFDTSLPIEEALTQYEKELPAEPFDLMVLGIGTDGHTASLFPGSRALKEEQKPVAHTTTDTFDVRDRLTLTFPPILQTKKLLILLKGKEKQDVLNKLTSGKEVLPATRLLTHPNAEFHLFLPPA